MSPGGAALVVVAVLLEVALFWFALGFTGTRVQTFVSVPEDGLREVIPRVMFALLLSIPSIVLAAAGILLVVLGRRR